VIMGRQIAPEDALFADGRAVSAAASAGVDLNLEGGQNRVDFDLLGEPSLATASPESGLDLDLGSALGPTGERPELTGTDPTAESRRPGASLDFVLENTQQIASSEATGSTRNMHGAGAVPPDATLPRATPSPMQARGSGTTREMPAVAGGSEIAGDAPTVEQPQLRAGEHATIRQKLDAASRQGLASAEQTAELAIDDLGLDLPGLHTPAAGAARPAAASGADSPVSADAPTMLAELTPHLQQQLARTQTEGSRVAQASQPPATNGVTAEPAAHGATGAMRGTGTWLFTDTDFGSIKPLKPQNGSQEEPPTQRVAQISVQPPVDTSSTSLLAPLDASDLDLDLGAIEGAGERRADEIDLDVGAPTADGTYPPPRRKAGAGAAGAEEALPDLEPVTLSEVGTKLDLARAYMDMGDPEGARSILSEVLTEGSVSQKQEARRLMDALPG